MQPQRPVERKQPQEETIEYHIGLHRIPQARSPYVAAMNVQNSEELKVENGEVALLRRLSKPNIYICRMRTTGTLLNSQTKKCSTSRTMMILLLWLWEPLKAWSMQSPSK